MDWSGYELAAVADCWPHKLSRKEARMAYDAWWAGKPDRIEQLRKLLKRNGLDLENSDEAVQRVNEWYMDNVEARQRPMHPTMGHLSDRWCSVAVDLSSFLGDVMIERSPSLRWEFYLPSTSKALGYQDHVVAGFGDGPVYDLDRIVSGVGNTALNLRYPDLRGPMTSPQEALQFAEQGRSRFVQLLHIAQKRAG